MYGQFNMKSESFEMIILKSCLNVLILKGNLVTRTLKRKMNTSTVTNERENDGKSTKTS